MGASIQSDEAEKIAVGRMQQTRKRAKRRIFMLLLCGTFPCDSKKFLKVRFYTDHIHTLDFEIDFFPRRLGHQVIVSLDHGEVYPAPEQCQIDFSLFTIGLLEICSVI